MSAFGLDATFWALWHILLPACCLDSPTSRSYLPFEYKAPILSQKMKLLMAEGQGEKEKKNNMYCWQSYGSIQRLVDWHLSVHLAVASAVCRWRCTLLVQFSPWLVPRLSGDHVTIHTPCLDMLLLMQKWLLKELYHRLACLKPVCKFSAEVKAAAMFHSSTFFISSIIDVAICATPFKLYPKVSVRFKVQRTAWRRSTWCVFVT